MNLQDKRKKLAALLAGDRCVIAGSVFDPLSARIADEVGFEVGLLGGSVASFAVLGAPDLMLLTLTELAEQTRRICRASKLPVLIDADHGFGNALNVMRTVEELASAGAAGLSIEDTLLPRAFGSPKEPSLTSVEEGVGRMRAAVTAARESGIAIFGRTAAVAITHIDDAVRRLQAYEQAGVNALFVPYLKTRAQLDRIADSVGLPLILGSPGAELMDLEYLANRRVRVCLRGHQGFAASVQALYDTARAVLAGTAPGELQNVAPENLIARLTKAPEHERWSEQFLTSSTAGQELKLVNDAIARRYRLMSNEEEVGYAEYDPVAPASILIKHTEVLPQHEGKGFGSHLVSAMLDDIRGQGKTVIPICPYAMNYIRKHREYLDIVRADLRATL